MKSWLQMMVAITLFVAGMTVGRFGLFPNAVAEAQPTPPVDIKNVQTWGTAGGSFSWQQSGTILEVKVTGLDAAYLAVADPTDENASLGMNLSDSDTLYIQDHLEVDLNSIKDLVFFRLEPIGGLSQGVFLPCTEAPFLCFPTRPPVFPPSGMHILMSQGSD